MLCNFWWLDYTYLFFLVPQDCEDGDLRLVGDDKTSTSGTLEICIGKLWGTVCDDGWDDRDAAVACGKLGFSTKGQSFFGKTSQQTLMHLFTSFATQMQSLILELTLAKEQGQSTWTKQGVQGMKLVSFPVTEILQVHITANTMKMLEFPVKVKDNAGNNKVQAVIQAACFLCIVKYGENNCQGGRWNTTFDKAGGLGITQPLGGWNRTSDKAAHSF